MLFLTILTLPISKIPVLPPVIQCFINVNLRMLLMKEYNPDKHARIHFLLDHTQARNLFLLLKNIVTSLFYHRAALGQRRKTAATAIAHRAHELFDKGNKKEQMLFRFCSTHNTAGH